MTDAQAIDLLKELVSIPSLSGQEESCSLFLVEQMKELGLSARMDEVGNALGVREVPDENGRVGQEILLLGHIDTVPGNIPVRIQEGNLYGRGTVDAKGALAACVTATVRARLQAGTRVVVIGAVEEESATSRGARLVAENCQPDFCVIGEPSGWDGVTLGYKGRVLFNYRLELPQQHSAGPDSNAAERAVCWWNEVCGYAQRYNEGRSRLFDQLMPSLRSIQTTSDGITQKVELRIGLRLPPDYPIHTLKTMLREQAGEAVLDCYGYEPAFQSSRTTTLAAAFNRALLKAGARAHFKLKTGTSDMNVVGASWGCPILAYGPGDSRLDHTPEEHLPLDEYLRSIRVLQEVLETVRATRP